MCPNRLGRPPASRPDLLTPAFQDWLRNQHSISSGSSAPRRARAFLRQAQGPRLLHRHRPLAVSPRPESCAKPCFYLPGRSHPAGSTQDTTGRTLCQLPSESLCDGLHATDPPPSGKAERSGGAGARWRPAQRAPRGRARRGRSAFTLQCMIWIQFTWKDST